MPTYYLMLIILYNIANLCYLILDILANAVQGLEREIANFSKEQGARLQAAKEKLKAAKVDCALLWLFGLLNFCECPVSSSILVGPLSPAAILKWLPLLGYN